MKTLLAFLIILVSTLALAEEDRFKLLQEQRKVAIERAIFPINATYVTELKALLKILIATGDLDAAVKVREEIEKYEKPVEITAQGKPKPETSLERLLDGTEWDSYEWNKKDDKYIRKFDRSHVYRFFVDGKKEILQGEATYEVIDPLMRKIKVTWPWAKDNPELLTVNPELTEITNGGGGVVAKILK